MDKQKPSLCIITDSRVEYAIIPIYKLSKPEKPHRNGTWLQHGDPDYVKFHACRCHLH